MADYHALYIKMFSAAADATEAIENGNAERALEILILAQQNAEEVVISDGE